MNEVRISVSDLVAITKDSVLRKVPDPTSLDTVLSCDDGSPVAWMLLRLNWCEEQLKRSRRLLLLAEPWVNQHDKALADEMMSEVKP